MKLKEYTIYTGDNCHDCAEVIAKLGDRSEKFNVINVDHSNANTPIPVFAFPVLFKGDILVAYGFDILNKL